MKTQKKADKCRHTLGISISITIKAELQNFYNYKSIHIRHSTQHHFDGLRAFALFDCIITFRERCDLL